MPAKRIMYVEQKTEDRGNRGLSDRGPAMIVEVAFSKTGQTVYADGKTFKKHSGIYGNYLCEEDGNEYWISGVKKRGSNRLFGNAPVVDKTGAPSDQTKTVARNSRRENAPLNPVTAAALRAECCVGMKWFVERNWKDAACYLIGERFSDFVKQAQNDPEFQAEVPAFVDEIKSVFEPWQVELYFDEAERREVRDKTLVRRTKELLLAKSETNQWGRESL